jgi:amino acid permease
LSIDKIFVFLVIFAILIGLGYGLFYIPNIIHDPQSTWLRFSQNFVNLWTVFPLGVIGFGIFIVMDAVRKRHRYGSETLYKLVFCGILMILVGFLFFGFYIID